MTVHGRVDCYINPTDPSIGRRQQEIFANICAFLTGVNGQALGIQLVAANWQTGSGGHAGLGFWDNPDSASTFTWSVWRFNNAPRGAFDMMIAIFSGSGQSLVPFDVSTNTGTVFGANNSFAIVGWSAACHPSGSSTHPWNGTTFNIGRDALGANNNVWVTGSGGTGAFFPRANNPADGTNGSLKNFMIEMHDDAQFALPMRLHIIATEGSLTVVQDPGLTSAYRFFHFGSYNPRPGVAPDAPYFMISGQTNASTNGTIKMYGSLTYGGTGGQSFNNGGDGGVAVPLLTSGSKNVALTTIGGTNLDANIGNFNFWVNSGSGGAYDLLPAYVCVQDAVSLFNGILGVADYFNLGIGMLTNTVNLASSTVAFGPATANTLKIILPWSGSSPGSLVGVRTGREF